MKKLSLCLGLLVALGGSAAYAGDASIPASNAGMQVGDAQMQDAHWRRGGGYRRGPGWGWRRGPGWGGGWRRGPGWGGGWRRGPGWGWGW